MTRNHSESARGPCVSCVIRSRFDRKWNTSACVCAAFKAEASCAYIWASFLFLLYMYMCISYGPLIWPGPRPSPLSPWARAGPAWELTCWEGHVFQRCLRCFELWLCFETKKEPFPVDSKTGVSTSSYLLPNIAHLSKISEEKCG